MPSSLPRASAALVHLWTGQSRLSPIIWAMVSKYGFSTSPMTTERFDSAMVFRSGFKREKA